ncbi:hypothetical protein BDQ12DRAFT_748605, partial [Crucibulum laeve]
FTKLSFRRLGEVTEAFQQFLRWHTIAYFKFFMYTSYSHHHPMTLYGCLYPHLVQSHDGYLESYHHFRFWNTYDGVSRKFKWNERWTVKPVKYFFIDFQYSRRYSAKEDRKTISVKGKDRSVPKLSSSVPYDPFKVDVYYLGNVINMMMKLCSIPCCKCLLKCILHQEYDDLELLRLLADTRTRMDPIERSTAFEAYEKFKSLICNLKKNLKSRIWRKDLR